MKGILILSFSALMTFGAQAQYAAPGAKPAPAAPLRPTVPAVAPVKLTAVASTGPAALAPLCFEPMDLRDTALISALQSNGLLCVASTKQGDPVRLLARPNGELSAESGPATAWHRFR